MKRGRKRNPSAIRDKKGKSRGEGIHPETIVRRERELEELGIPLIYYQAEGARTVQKPTALTSLAGFSLGQLYLRWQKDESDRFGVTEEQYQAGETWSEIVRQHASVMDYELKRSTESQGWISVGRGLSCEAEPDEETVLRIRSKFKRCYGALSGLGWRVVDIVYQVCIENRDARSLTEMDVEFLRRGLNALVDALTSNPRIEARLCNAH